MQSTFTLSLLVLLLPLLSMAQPRAEYFFHEEKSLIYPRMISVHPDGHFVTGNGRVPGIDGCESFRLDFWGEAFERLPVALPQDGGDGQLYPLASGWQGDKLFVLGAKRCNTFSEGLNGFNALLTYDKEGALLQQSQSWLNCELSIFHFAARPEGSNCSVLDFDEAGQPYVALEEGVFTFPTVEDFPEQVGEALQLRGLIGLAALPGQRMAVCSAEEVSLLDLATEEVLWSVPVAANSMTAVGESLWFASADSLYRLGVDLAQHAWPLPEGASPNLKLLAHEGLPLLYEYYGNNSGSSYRGWHFEEAEEAYERLFDWPAQAARVLAIAPIGPDSCYMSGWKDSRPLLKKTAFADLSFTSEFDLGVAEVSVELLEQTIYPNSGGPLEFSIDFAVEGVVENYGADPVQSFQLDWLRDGFFCFSPAVQIFEGLDLASGDRLAFRDTLRYFSAVSSVEQLTEIGLSLRFATYAPNHYLDANTANDVASYNLVLTSLHEPSLLEAEVRLFPNPAPGSVQVSSSLPLQGYELYDGLGRLLRRSTLEDALGFELHRQGLPAGVYLLRLSGGHGQVTKRVVWQQD